MYVPAVLAEGQTLYRDTWFMYGPVSPYLNSYLFRLFGTHLTVLYWAGSLSALGSALALLLIGRRLATPMVGWAAGAVLLLQAFERSLFCFPLPYSFAAVYGCLVGCTFLWVAVLAAQTRRTRWVFAAGCLAASALLIKPEFGIASYATLAILLVLRRRRGEHQASLHADCAAVVPGVAVVAVIAYWMVSLEGIEFITHENIVMWPTSYFMRTYGVYWLEITGFVMRVTAFQDALLRAVFPAGVWLELYLVFRWKRQDTVAAFTRLTLFFGMVMFSAQTLGLSPRLMTASLMFPRDMVLYVGVGAMATWLLFWRQPGVVRDPTVPILFTFASLLAFRILFNMVPAGYAIFYNGPVILCFLLLVRAAVLGLATSRRVAGVAELALCVGCVWFVSTVVGHWVPVKRLVPLVTERGTVRVPSDFADNYKAAIAFMSRKARAGEYVLSVPEDTSLYFLARAYSPTRVYAFTPGVIAPGKMTEDTIREIESKRVRYVLWSNREFPEFGVPVFGTDFNQRLGEHLRANYELGARLTSKPGWTVDVWERKPGAGFK
jgi:hypothetical protein